MTSDFDIRMAHARKKIQELEQKYGYKGEDAIVPSILPNNYVQNLASEAVREFAMPLSDGKYDMYWNGYDIVDCR